MSDPQIGVNLAAATVAVAGGDNVIGIQQADAVIMVEGAGANVQVSVASAEVTVQLGGPAGPPGPPGEGGDAPIYVGPADQAPAVTEPTLMILRDAGAPAGQTSIIVREPD